MKLSEIAEKLSCKLEGDANAEITRRRRNRRRRTRRPDVPRKSQISPRAWNHARLRNPDRPRRRPRSHRGPALRESLSRFRARHRTLSSPRRNSLPGSIPPPLSRSQQRSAQERTSARTASLMKTSKSDATPCCTASSRSIAARKLATTSSPTRTAPFASTAASAIASCSRTES